MFHWIYGLKIKQTIWSQMTVWLHNTVLNAILYDFISRGPRYFFKVN
jgi:hypothetical protein